MTRVEHVQKSIGVFYLAWGGRLDPLEHARFFLESYKRFDPGVKHELYIICKGFVSFEEMRALRELMQGTPHSFIYVDERELDIGAYYAAAAQTDCDFACFLNTYSEILGENWLVKLMNALLLPGMGLVGCSGSYEAPSHGGRFDNIPFPNPHLRSNAFMLSRELFLRLKTDGSLNDKLSTYMFEHQRSSLTRRIISAGLDVAVVGKDGRAYLVNEWPRSRTFRQGGQSNLLIGDNRTRDFDAASAAEKRRMFQYSWGDRSNGRVTLPAVEDHTAYDLVSAAYQSVLRRAPTVSEFVDGAKLLSDREEGSIQLLSQLLKSPEFTESGRIMPGFIGAVRK